MGNLLIFNNSFIWANRTVDRKNQIDNLNKAIISASCRDNLYYNPEIFADETESFRLFSLVWEGYDIFREAFPWIREPEYQILSTLINYFKKVPNNSIDLEQLKVNTSIENNAYIGFESHCPDFLVYDNSTWYEFHSLFVSTFTLEQRRNNFEYFSYFFKPSLTKPLNQIQQSIDSGQVHNSISRIDQALIPHEKIHIHFNKNENCALNIDGTWKHKVEGFRINEEACIQLNEWGFKLPDEYYNKQ